MNDLAYQVEYLVSRAGGLDRGDILERLQNSLRMQEEDEKALAALPRGVLVKKYVKGHQYYYLMTREGDKVRFECKGKLPGI